MIVPDVKVARVAVVALALCVLAAACGATSDNGGDEGKIIAANYGGVSGDTIAEVIAAPYEQASGNSIQHVASGVGFIAKVQAQSEAEKISWDIIEGAGVQEAALMWSEGLLEPLPDDLRAELTEASIPNAVNDYGVLLGTTGYAIACNMETIDACPSNPAEFWDSDSFPGRRAMVNNPFAAMATALVADGVPTDDVFPMDIERAFAKLEEIRPNVNVWTTSGDQQVQIMRDGQVDMSIMWNGRAKAVIDEGVPLQMEWEGSLANPNYMVVVKGGPNTDAAMEYLKWYGTHAQPQAEVAKKLAYGMSHKDVVAMLSDEAAALLPEGGDNAENQVQLDGEWWVNNADAVAPLWKEFLAA